MKKLKIFIITLFLCLGVATMGWCYYITDGPYLGETVGELDFLEATISGVLFKTDYGGNSPENETKWVNSVLDPDVTFYVKNETVTYYNTDEPNVYAFPITTPPESEYFLLKNDQWYALFQNNAQMDWGVFSSDDLPPDMNVGGDEFTISHVDRFDGTPTTPVPEPATMLLFGTGILGIAALGRKKFIR